MVLDSSAVIAVLRREAGAENVIPHLRTALISSVNVAEVFYIAEAEGAERSEISSALARMEITEVGFDREQAERLASLYSLTRGGSVGFADRACLALADRYQLPVLTGDREWIKYDIDLDIRLFRHAEAA